MRLIWLLLSTAMAMAMDMDLDSPDSVKSTAKKVAKNMLSYYTGMNPGDNPGNLPDPYYWWEAGAMFTALIDYWYFTGDDSWNDITTQAIIWQAGDDGTFMPSNQTRTEGNDDQGFWAFAAMAAAERNFPNPPDDVPGWLAMAQAVFNTQARRWDTETCGGGLKWQIFTFNSGYDYKNTISNGCFFNLATRLAKYTGNQTYADWADRIWDWTVNVGFMSDTYQFWDGADDRQNCTGIGRLEWTYNSGVYLFGAAMMYNFTEGDPVWGDRTEKILDSANESFFNNSIMYERACEPVNTCQVDQRSFKGYLARWMAATTQVAPFTFDKVMPLLRATADAAVKTCTGGDDGHACGMKWMEKHWDGTEDAGLQMAVLEVVQSTLISRVDPPVTHDHGGTSKGNPGGGGRPPNPQPGGLTMNITTGDKAGAGVFTVVVSLIVIGSTGWMIWD